MSLGPCLSMPPLPSAVPATLRWITGCIPLSRHARSVGICLIPDAVGMPGSIFRSPRKTGAVLLVQAQEAVDQAVVGAHGEVEVLEVEVLIVAV